MSNVFEYIKNLFFIPLLKRTEMDTKKYNCNNNDNKYYVKAQNEKEGDDTSILLEGENNELPIKHYLNQRKLLSTSLIKNKLLPLLYLIFSFSSIMFLMLCENTQMKKTENYILINGYKDRKFFNFFKLYNLNPLIFHIFSLITGIIGICIVRLVQTTIYLKSLNFYRVINSFSLMKIYLTSFFGIFSQLIHILIGIVYFFSNYRKFSLFIQSELNISLHQFLFCIEIFFSVLYGIFILITLNKLIKVDVLEADVEHERLSFSDNFNYNKPNQNLFYGNQQSTIYHTIPDNLDSKWLTFKILCVVYLAVFSFCYTILLLIKNDKVKAIDKETPYYNLNQTYLLIFLPYLLYMLNSIFYSLFYEILKYSSTFHIELTSQNVYDKSQKNML